MINPLPLLIVMGTILTLLVVQRLLARVQPPGQKHNAGHRSTSSAVATPAENINRPRGRKLVDGISVVGLDERGVNSLRALILQNDPTTITTFLAFNRPGFVEIDACLSEHRKHPTDEAPTTSKSSTLAEHLLAPLSKTERKQILRFSAKSPRLISRELMTRFGGHEFNTYFSHYAARPQSVTLHIPPFDPDRKIFEDLAKSGVARKGRHIPLDVRLTVLKMSQLRQMAKDLNLDKKFTRKKDATQALATVPGAAVLLSMQYVVDDLFMLLPLDEDIEKIKSEWEYLQAYAKLLGGLKAKLTN